MIIVDNETLTTGQIVRYLQSAGKLQTFILDIMRQHIVDREIKARTELQPSPETLAQAIVNFRQQRQLTEQPAFDQWLTNSGLNLAGFEAQMAAYLTQENIKAALAGPDLEGYFKERKPALEQVVLSRIVVQDKSLADTLLQQIQEKKATFETLAKTHSLSTDKTFNGMMGAIGFNTLPNMLQTSVMKAQPGDLIGPLELDGYWSLFRFEQFIPVSLDDPNIKQRLQGELFDQWIGREMQKLSVKLEVQG